MEFIQKQVEEFDIGKRHLANMMGEDPENFTQEDVDVRDCSVVCMRGFSCVHWLVQTSFFLCFHFSLRDKFSELVKHI